MKYCSKCGNELKAEDVFCSKCGAKTSVFGVTKKPEKGTQAKGYTKSTYGRLRADTLPGDRYTAAVEKNAIAVTEYFKRATEMEWQKYQSEEIERQLKAREDKCLREIAATEEAIKTCEDKAAQTEKSIKEYKKLEYRRKVYNFKAKPDLRLTIILFLAMLALYIGGRIAKVPAFQSAGLGVLLIVVVPVVTITVVQAVKYFRGKSAHEKNEDEATVKYEEEQEQLAKDTLESLNNDLNDYNNIIARHKNEKARIENITLKEIRREMDESRKMTAQLAASLEDYYSTEVIYPKYRSLVPVSTMYGYLEEGKCMDLTGHDGAYSTYEKELKIDAISDKLSGIHIKPDGTSENQQGVLDSFSKMRGSVDSLMRSLDSVLQKNLKNNPDGNELSKPLEHSKDIANYYLDVNSKRQENMEYMHSVAHYSRHWF